MHHATMHHYTNYFTKVANLGKSVRVVLFNVKKVELNSELTFVSHYKLNTQLLMLARDHSTN